PRPRYHSRYSDSSQHADQSHQEYRSHNRDQNIGNDAAAAIDAKQTEQVAANDGAGNAQQNVGEHTVARALHNLSGRPARDQSHQNDVKDVHRCLPLRLRQAVYSSASVARWMWLNHADMFARKIRVEYEEDGQRRACPLKW